MKPYYKLAIALGLFALIIVIPISSENHFSFYKKLPLFEPRILIVPGHEPSDGGAIFKTAHEREIAVAIAYKLKTLLEVDGVEVIVARDNERWDPLFQTYFDTHKDEIDSWVEEHKEDTKQAIDSGELKEVVVVEHNAAPAETAFHLYGINKWIQENTVSLVIHVHVNDDVRKNRKVPGKYSGFALYIPEAQSKNSAPSRKLAESLKKTLGESYGPSTLAIEGDTIIESQELIALGEYQTLDATPAVLVEYGYIYESIFGEAEQEKNVELMADKTYQGIKAFLSL